MTTLRFAIIGCGYVADYYMATLGNHPGLELAGVFDRDPLTLARFCAYHRVRAYASLDALLDDPRVALVANLTNPSSHYDVSSAALTAGKHVYSEKPLALELDQAEALVEMAEQRRLRLSSAPCSVLGETAQTLWRALREQRIGVPRLVYAELDDGHIAAMNLAGWKSASGAPWPAKDEFEVGCTLEHAGYYLTWLTAFFGPASRVTAFSTILQHDKGVAVDIATPDFATACIEFRSGVTARLTCSIYAAHDHRLRIFGDDGRLSVDQAWNYGAAIAWTRRHRYSGQADKYPRLARLAGLGPRSLPLARCPRFRWRTAGANPMDFCRGIAEMADAIAQDRPHRMSARWSLHVNELVLAMQYPGRYGSPREVQSSFEPMAPMDWAADR